MSSRCGTATWCSNLVLQVANRSLSCRSAGAPPESHTLQRQRTLEWLNAVSRAPESPHKPRDRRISADQAVLGQQETGPWGPIIRRRRPSFFNRCAERRSNVRVVAQRRLTNCNSIGVACRKLQ